MDEKKVLAKQLVTRARALYEDPKSNTRYMVWDSLEFAVSEMLFQIDDAAETAREALDLPSWRHDNAPDWEESLKILEK
jgi:hypothetical protein